MFSSDSRTGVAQTAVVALVAVVVYLNTLPNGFVVDDVHQVVDNAWITDARHLPEIFTQGVWDFEGRASSYYRPLMYVLYMGVHGACGRSAWAFHLLNILMHAGVSVLVMAVARRAFPLHEPRAPVFLAAPFVAGLLFATHPIHTEPVAWIAGINDLGFALFGLLAILLYITSPDRTWGRLAASALAFLLALLCKETAVVLPGIALAHDLSFRRDRPGAWSLAGRLAPWAAAAAVCGLLRVNALGGALPTVGSGGLETSRYALALLALLARYVEMLVLPLQLNFWHAFEPPVSIVSGEALRALAVVGAGAVVAVAIFRSRAARFALVLLVLPLLPTFHLGALNQGLENAFAERYLYLPSAGWVMLVALATDALRRRTRPRLLPAAAVIVLLAGVYAAGTVRRNPIWKDHLSLWSDAVRKSPGSAVPHMNHGAALLYAGRMEEGTAELRKAAAMQPDLVDRELAKGAAYLAKGLHVKAILTLHMALALDPRCAPAHFNLGLVYESLGRTDAATAEYEKAIALQPDYADAHNNLGVLHAEGGRLGAALARFESAVRLRPDDPEYRANLERAQRR